MQRSRAVLGDALRSSVKGGAGWSLPSPRTRTCRRSFVPATARPRACSSCSTARSTSPRPSSRRPWRWPAHAANCFRWSRRSRHWATYWCIKGSSPGRWRRIEEAERIARALLPAVPHAGLFVGADLCFQGVAAKGRAIRPRRSRASLRQSRFCGLPAAAGGSACYWASSASSRPAPAIRTRRRRTWSKGWP